MRKPNIVLGVEVRSKSRSKKYVKVQQSLKDVKPTKPLRGGAYWTGRSLYLFIALDYWQWSRPRQFPRIEVGLVCCYLGTKLIYYVGSLGHACKNGTLGAYCLLFSGALDSYSYKFEF